MLDNCLLLSGVEFIIWLSLSNKLNEAVRVELLAVFGIASFGLLTLLPLLALLISCRIRFIKKFELLVIVMSLFNEFLSFKSLSMFLHEVDVDEEADDDDDDDDVEVGEEDDEEDVSKPFEVI